MFLYFCYFVLCAKKAEKGRFLSPIFRRCDIWQNWTSLSCLLSSGAFVVYAKVKGSPATRALCVIFMILVSHENVKKCVLGGYTITSKTKINIFKKFYLTSLAASRLLHSKFFPKTLILAFEANSALSCETETKIVKITHSATCSI